MIASGDLGSNIFSSYPLWCPFGFLIWWATRHSRIHHPLLFAILFSPGIFIGPYTFFVLPAFVTVGIWIIWYPPFVFVGILPILILWRIVLLLGYRLGTTVALILFIGFPIVFFPAYSILFQIIQNSYPTSFYPKYRETNKGYYPDGKVRSEHHRDGRVTEYSKGGKKIAEWSGNPPRDYSNYNLYYEDGTLKEQSQKNNNLTTRKFYRPNGSLDRESVWDINQAKEVSLKIYYENGRLKQEKNETEGWQELFTEDGALLGRWEIKKHNVQR